MQWCVYPGAKKQQKQNRQAQHNLHADTCCDNIRHDRQNSKNGYKKPFYIDSSPKRKHFTDTEAY